MAAMARSDDQCDDRLVWAALPMEGNLRGSRGAGDDDDDDYDVAPAA
jgi:hypothetical protein